ncbi:hypothetical protein QQS21_002003 [Conoideocrella luteorostrata]|uniref:Xylanolytic transcriptional activator regulatory domain-containing protein n=1 Tax=Conoideocrella luteorostrata TaxID=1105319 RepID=A0AAJ0CZ68_9HYPO|nr:hypothetical protein QQS21_002003 [Conoideocrella luteorostrata]
MNPGAEKEFRDGSTPLNSSESHRAPYRGPTSTEFTLKVVMDDFGDIGSSSSNNRKTRSSCVPLNINTTSDSEFLADQKPLARLLSDDPLQEMGLCEVQRLISVFTTGPGLIYPIVESSELLETSQRLFEAFGNAKASQKVIDLIDAAEELTCPSTVTLKLVLANALAQENCQLNRPGQRLFDSIRSSLGSSFWGVSDLRKVLNWVLVASINLCFTKALLHFHLDEELQASRVTAHASRLCLELGINRRDILGADKELDDAVLAAKLVLAVFVLDRRSSIALGIPFVIQDQDLETALVVQDKGGLYLQTTASLARIAGEASRMVSRLSDKTANIKSEEIDYLDYQLSQAQRAIPSEFQFQLADFANDHILGDVHRSDLYRNVILFLRVNHLRSLIHRPALYTTERFTVYQGYALTAIDSARETVQVLHQLGHKTVILQTHPIFFKFFLTSSFSILMLAIVKGSANQTQPRANGQLSVKGHVQREFYLALDLFQLLSGRSPAMMRIWKYVSRLETVAAQLGFVVRAAPRESALASQADSEIPSESLEPIYENGLSQAYQPRQTPGVQKESSEQISSQCMGMQFSSELYPFWGVAPDLSAPMMFGSDFDIFDTGKGGTEDGC